MLVNTGPDAARGFAVQSWDGDDVRWDEFVASDDNASFCHLAGWHDIMADALGNECEYLRALDETGRVVAALPLVHVRSRMFGRYLVSMPFLNYGGALGLSAARLHLVEKAVAIARRRDARLLELRTRMRSEPSLETQERRVTVLLDLPADADALFRAFPSKLRSQIRRPQKAGLTTVFGTEHVDAFHAVFAHTMRDLGTPVLPRRFFEMMAQRFERNVVLGVVRRADGEPVAAGFGFAWGGEVEITWAGALRAFSAEAPNMLLYWSFMEESIRRGVPVFNFGRCRPGGGTHRFKLQWGGRDQPLPWSVWSNGATQPPTPDQSGYGLAVRAWQRLPLRVANAVGPLIARRLP